MYPAGILPGFLLPSCRLRQFPSGLLPRALLYNESGAAHMDALHFPSHGNECTAPGGALRYRNAHGHRHGQVADKDLSFSKSIPGYMVIICIKLENHTKFRHIAKLLHRIIGKCGTNSSISENFISKCTLSCRNSGKKIGIGYLYGMLFFLYLWCISRSICRSAVILMVYIPAGYK